MELYHGGVDIIQRPDVGFGREELDFGKGFYLTDIYAQAESWARHVSEDREIFPPLINVYSFDKENFLVEARTRIFEGYSDEWLDFVVRNRLGERLWQEYDYIEGSIADDRVLRTVRLYMGGYLTASEALNRLQYERTNNQICILNQDLSDRFLKFKRYIEL